MIWFHCGRCGSLFKAVGGDFPDRICVECGRNPSLGLEPIVVAGSGPAEVLPFVRRSTEDLPKEAAPHEHKRNRHGKGRRKGSYLVPLIIGGWMVFIVLIILGARLIWGGDPEVAERGSAAASSQNAGPSGEDRLFLEMELQDSRQAFANFLAAASPESASQFVVHSAVMAGRMARFFQHNPLIRLDAATLSSEGEGVLALPDGRGIETRWRSSDGLRVEAVFLRERNEWRLDWEHFVRYSDYPWPLFLAGGGEPVGEFRLFARERLAGARTENGDMSLVFHAPRFGDPGATTAQSPEFVILRQDPAWDLLDAAFRMEKEGVRPFGGALPGADPGGLIRVRVRIRRNDDDAGQRFEVEEVIACHWLSIDDPGIVAERGENPDQSPPSE